MNPDEMEYFEEEANEELRRLQELTELQNNSDDEDEDVDVDNTLPENGGFDDFDIERDIDVLAFIRSWSWDWEKSQRLLKAAKFLRIAHRLLVKICRCELQPK